MVVMVVAIPAGFVVIAKGRKIAGRMWGGHQARGVPELIRDGELALAGARLAQAMEYSPKDPALMRLLDDLLVASKAPAGDRVANLRALLDLKGTEDADWLRMARATLDAGEWQSAREMLARLPPSLAGGGEALRIKAALLENEGKTAEAEQVHRAILRASPEDPEARRVVALLDLKQPFDEQRAAGRQALFALAAGEGAAAERALLNVATLPDLSATEGRRLRELAEDRSLQEDVRLRIMCSVLKACPMDKEELVAAEMNKAQGADVEKRCRTFRWMIENGHASLVLRQIQPGEAISDGQMYLTLVSALRSLRRWDDMRQMLSGSAPPVISKAQLAVLQADCDLRSGSRDSGEQRLRSVMEEARKAGSAAALRMVLGVADEFGLIEIAVECQEQLALHAGDHRIQMLNALYGRLMKMGDSGRVLDTLKRMLAELPEHDELRRKVSYFRLLTGREIELASLDASGPPVGTDHLNRALSAYRMGLRDDLERALEGAAQWDDLGPGQRAVAAGLLKHIGREIEALALWEKLPAAEMLPEERSFIDRVVAGTL